MHKNVVSKSELEKLIKEAKKEIRVLGVLPFSLDWNKYRKIWRDKIDDGNLTVEIICESKWLTNYYSIIADDRNFSGQERSYRYGNFIKIIDSTLHNLKKYLEDNNCKYLEPESDMKNVKGYIQRFSLRTCYLPINIPTIQIDDEYYIALTLTSFVDVDKFEKVTKEHIWHDELKKYFEAYFEYDFGAKKFSTEETEKGNRLEVIQAFDEKRMPIGILPRDSFLDSKQLKLVVWGILFTREGKMLIHRRSINAKDNQGMWDKSVGGHVSLDDVDTVKAVARELAEELYTAESPEQGGHNESAFFNVNVDKMIFLGEWLPNSRYTMPFKDVNYRPDESHYFRINYDFSKRKHDSPRLLPDGKVKDASMFVDIFVCIASENFKIDKLENSEYMLVEVHELKDMYSDGYRYVDEMVKKEENEKTIEVKTGKRIPENFKVSPDLKEIIRSSMLDDLAMFSDYVKDAFRKYEEDK